MLVIEGRDCEVIIDGVALETIEGVHRSSGPLPYITNDIVKVSMFEMVYRGR